MGLVWNTEVFFLNFHPYCLLMLSIRHLVNCSRQVGKKICYRLLKWCSSIFACNYRLFMQKQKGLQLSPPSRLICDKGPYIKDVRTEGGRGGLRIARFCGQIRLIGCVKCGRGGGGVSKITEFLRTSFMYGPEGARARPGPPRQLWRTGRIPSKHR